MCPILLNLKLVRLTSISLYIKKSEIGSINSKANLIMIPGLNVIAMFLIFAAGIEVEILFIALAP